MNTTVSFSPAVNYSAAGSPYFIITGDFNGDGKIDLAVTNLSSDNVSILIGNGNGTFQTQQTYAVGDFPNGITGGDFNGDGKTDLAVTNLSSDNVSILIGNGNGTFQTQQIYALGDSPNGITGGDFNGDGKSDLAVTNAYSANFLILIGNGNGTFQTQQIYALGDSPSGITGGDFNGDGKSDLAVSNFDSDNVSILIGNGNGTFQIQQTYATGDCPNEIARGDFNGDGKIDLAITTSGVDKIDVLFGRGDGTFATRTSYAVGNWPCGIVVGDFNGDNYSDIAVANEDSNNVSLLLNNGNGTFAAQITYAAGNYPIGLATADFNGDGKIDLASANDDSVSVFLNNSPYTPNPVTSGSSKTFSTTPNLAIANPGKITSPLTVSGMSGAITDVNVKININHSFDADLDVYLIAPTGKRIELFTDVGGASDNFVNTILDQEAKSSINSGRGPFTGSFIPEGNLAALYGINPNGDWKLEVNDDDSTASGVLKSWGLTISVPGGTTTAAPINQVPGAQTLQEDNALLFESANRNTVSVADADSATLTVTLSVTNGFLSLANTGGLNFISGDGKEDLNLKFSGASSAINSALNGLEFTPSANYSGTATLKIETSDGTNRDSDAVALTILAVNDAPEGKVTISGNPQSGQTLTASNNLTDADGPGTISYQWLRNGSATGITANNYPLTASDENTAISVQAVYIDGGGTQEKVVSEPLMINKYVKPGVKITPMGNSSTSELGGTAQFNVVLNSQPTAEVRVTFTSNNLAEGQLVNATLVFNATNWNTPQVLVIKGMDDAPNDRYSGSDPADGDIVYNISGKVISDDIDYIRDVDPAPLQLTNLDDPADTPQDLYGDLIPGNFRDRLTGGNGGDRIYGLLNIDELKGGRGDDLINGGQDMDFLYGELGNDTLEGDSGNDKLFGAEGEDNLSGGEGDDSLDGGSGNDQLNGDNGKDLLQGGDGIDVLNGGNQDDNLQGGAGDDQIFGQEGNDQLFGGDGVDILNGGTGANTMDGGNGADIYYLDMALTDVINDTGKDGAADTVIVPMVSRYTLAATIENGELSGSINASLTGNNLNNSLNGNTGKNTLDGGQGNDILSGGAGADSLMGGGGIDTADYSDAGGAVNANLTTGKVITGEGNDILTAIENLLGGGANDILNGNSGANVLTGGEGNDKLIGGSGADTINGGGGKDTLTGGESADYFVFSAAADSGIGAARDVITDFATAQGDKIDLRQFDANPDVEGIQAWSFISGAFDGNIGQVRFDNVNHVIQFNLNGDLQADFEIELTGVTVLTANNIILSG